MLIHLVFKDFLIVKKYVLLVLLVAVAVPPFLLWRNPELAAVLGQVFAAIFGVLMPLMYLGEKKQIRQSHAPARRHALSAQVDGRQQIPRFPSHVLRLHPHFLARDIVFPKPRRIQRARVCCSLFRRRHLSQSLPAAPI